ncbi:MAG: DUF5665 domain-containing protein [Clostridiales bacterium]|nr:DUF5665 domain-containing protein [Clostridiales bacterium]MDY2833909.1 DUF5665 domain-containing protein [Candidatus Aphodomonas sp.]
MRKEENDAIEKKLRSMLAEFSSYLHDRKHLLLLNFLAGLMRGCGFAVGFSILGAVVVIIARKLALDNLPVIGEFFAEVVRMVQIKLY